MHSNPINAQRFAADRQAAFRRQAGDARLNRSAKRPERNHHPLKPPPRASRSRG